MQSKRALTIYIPRMLPARTKDLHVITTILSPLTGEPRHHPRQHKTPASSRARRDHDQHKASTPARHQPPSERNHQVPWGRSPLAFDKYETSFTSLANYRNKWSKGLLLWWEKLPAYWVERCLWRKNLREDDTSMGLVSYPTNYTKVEWL